MPRADQPSTPSRELNARKAWGGPQRAGGVLTEELAAFCQSGVSIIVGTCAGGLPIAGIGLGCTIDAAGTVRLLLREPANTALIEALHGGAAIAATFSEPRTHRSIQLKGRPAHVGDPQPGDAEVLARQTMIFRRELESVDYSATFTAHYCAYLLEEMRSLAFMPAEAFVQTPGPGAGSALIP